MGAMTDDPRADDDRDDAATRELPVAAPWVVVSRTGRGATDDPVSPRRVLVLVAAGAVLVLVVSAVVGVFAARRLAERQAVNAAANTADLLAESVVQPALLDGVPDGPYAYEVADLARLARQLIDGPGDATSVAFAMTRPGGDPWTVSDRAWGRFLHATSADVGGTVWPAHLAHPKRLERYVLPTR